MNLSSLKSISPIDGRYHTQTSELAIYFSEYGLIKYRTLVEIEYFIALVECGLGQLEGFPKSKYSDLRNVYQNFSEANAESVKEIEKTTNHDVKAVEYFIKEQFDTHKLETFSEFIHFGLTSQDINNTAIPLSLRDAHQNVLVPHLLQVIEQISDLSQAWSEVSMLAKTHGQPASPTRLGKELAVFVERLNAQMQQWNAVPFSAKFGGAIGNFNAHHVAFPEQDWKVFGNEFVENILGLSRSQTTTQIEHYDNLAAYCDGLKRINTILIDFSRDVWQYVSMNYFKQKINTKEVGSSAMPHKVNPIDFENAEGNLGYANAILEHLSAKLPISRLQRDLTDSTTLRNLGVPLAHTLIAFKALQKGISKLELNPAAIRQDLEENWVVVAEGIQTILRREGYPKPYEALKQFTRNHTKITESTLKEFIDELKISDKIKYELKNITPFNYTGI